MLAGGALPGRMLGAAIYSRPCHTEPRMLPQIQNFFRQLIEPELQADPVHRQHGLQLATAALLVEMMRMDDKVSDPERATALAALRREFSLGTEELDALVTLGHSETDARKLIDDAISSGKKFKDTESLLTAIYQRSH